MAKWTKRSHASGFDLDTGALRLTVTDQNDRYCGWVWHVSVDHIYDGDTIERCGHLESADEAKRAACAWARAFCEKTLAAISEAEAV